MKLKEKGGISLIVLVITIIVIIILAVAVILSISNNNPIENARKARFLNDLKIIQEEVTLRIASGYANNYETYNPNTDPEIQGIIDKYEDYKEKIQVVNGKVVLVDDETKVSEQEKLWAQENGIEVKEKEEEYPVIPVGFKHIEGTVDTGYVIQNETDKNEFVWVPVEVSEGKTFEQTFERESFGDTYWNTTNYTEPYSYNGATADPSEIAEHRAMRNSVEKYKGFYIARYEASDNGSGKAQSKKDQPSWDIKWGNSMTDLSGGAVEKARAVYPNSDKADGSKYAVSTLCYGVQWDATVRWLKKNYPTITEDSSEYGNYEADSTINTGSNPKYVTNNIYDMCGNNMEFTMEALDDNIRICRGGYCGLSGAVLPISGRELCVVPDGSRRLSFRALHKIKKDRNYHM